MRTNRRSNPSTGRSSNGGSSTAVGGEGASGTTGGTVAVEAKALAEDCAAAAGAGVGCG